MVISSFQVSGFGFRVPDARSRASREKPGTRNPEPETQSKGLAYALLAVTLFSTTPVLILLADPLPALVKTWARMSVAALAIGAAFWLVHPDGTRRESGTATDFPLMKPNNQARDKVRFLGYGLIAALHFYFYIASLDYTTPAHSLAIVYTAPIFVTLFSARFLREPVGPRRWMGIAIAVLGIAVLAGLEPHFSLEIALGDSLALLSAITFGLYSVAGRYERERYPLLLYAYRVYGAAALWLLPAALLAFASAPPVEWGWQQFGAVLALGLGPLALGHTLYNAAVRRVHATYANIIASQEVTGGIILSWLILGQTPSLNSILGAIITLAGTALVLK